MYKEFFRNGIAISTRAVDSNNFQKFEFNTIFTCKIKY